MISYLWRVPHHQLDTGRGRLEELHGLLVMFSLHTDPVDTEELVSSLQAAVPVRHPTRDDPGDVDGGVLLLPAHHVEAEPLLGLGQLHHPGVGVALGSCEGSNCRLGCGGGSGGEETLLLPIVWVGEWIVLSEEIYQS